MVPLQVCGMRKRQRLQISVQCPTNHPHSAVACIPKGLLDVDLSADLCNTNQTLVVCRIHIVIVNLSVCNLQRNQYQFLALCGAYKQV